MARFHVYKDSEGSRLPSVTTILSRFRDSGGLLHWANAQGLKGKTLQEARERVADAGTCAHELVSADISGQPAPDFDAAPEVVAMARRAFDNYRRWRDQSRIDFTFSEIPLVSERHKFGGRLDMAGTGPDGFMCLGDIKTGHRVYIDYLLQTAAYVIAWNENHPTHPIEGGVHILCFARETADFSHHFYDQVEREKECFLAMRALYSQVKELEKRVK